MRKAGCCLFFSLCSFIAFTQTHLAPVLKFDFNEHRFKEADNKITIKPVGVSLVEDRFGNERSAAYTQGNATSYINLGSSDLLKPRRGSISMWVCLQDAILWGKGYHSNPIISIRNGPGEDFTMSRYIGYNYLNRRFGALATKDSLKHTLVHAKDTAVITAWYHLVITSDDDYFAFYQNGELQGKLIKGFESAFLKEDSVIIGRSMGIKNERFTNAIIDDIRFYDRVLSPEEVLQLYQEPNPNNFKNALFEILKYGIIILLMGGIIVITVIQNRRRLQKQKEYYELNNRIKELEIKVIKNQMNPHFVSNSLAAIQNLIYNNQAEKAAHYLANFSFFLRQVLNYSDQTYITLEQELNLIRMNIELEQLRFKDNFRYSINVNTDIYLPDIRIPSLITQPFIENAIWHGLLPLEGRDPHLNISVFLEKDIVFLEIEDNGVGRSETGIASEKISRGTKLAIDKMESTNQLSNRIDYKLEIVDLFNAGGLPSGTKIIIQLLHYNSEE